MTSMEKGEETISKDGNISGGHRDSSIELFRIVSMLVIVAHHYIVNSGVLQEITQENALDPKSLFALIFGWGGKTGIDGFVLITGYFMCQSELRWAKYLKLLWPIWFYGIVFWLAFHLFGYVPFSFSSVKWLIKTVCPLYSMGTEFTSSFLVFFCFIPYLNRLVKTMNEAIHRKLVLLCILFDTILPTFLHTPNAFTYIGWFMALYFIAAYIRLYPKPIFEDKGWGWRTLLALFLSWLSVYAGAFAYAHTGRRLFYYFVADSNKFLALITAVCAFMFFKNLRLSYSPVINKIAASAFGVLLIHANCDAMRRWLWRDTLDNVGAFHGEWFALRAIGSVVAVYVICTLIDMAQKGLIERRLFRYIERKIA